MLKRVAAAAAQEMMSLMIGMKDSAPPEPTTQKDEAPAR
jgi:hypothetical protein